MVYSPKYNAGMSEIINQLAAEIAKRGTISEAARRAGVSRPYLSNVLSGKHQPRIDWVERLAKTLGISLKISGR